MDGLEYARALALLCIGVNVRYSSGVPQPNGCAIHCKKNACAFPQELSHFQVGFMGNTMNNLDAH